MKKPLEPGSVYAVRLKSNKYVFGVVCMGSDVAFFDYLSDAPVAPENLLDLPLIFRVFVTIDAPKRGKWPKVGNVPLRGDYAELGKYLHKAVGSDQYYIYSGGSEVPASRDECIGLELFAVYFAMHAEERLEDYFAGGDSDYMRAAKKQLGII